MIIIKPMKSRWRHGFICEGHADFSEYGTDIVCAAISVLTQNCVLSLHEQTDATITSETRNGYLDVLIHEKHSRDTNLLINSMLSGIRRIAEAHPQHVRILEEPE